MECDECGMVYEAVAADQLAGALRAAAADLAGVLTGGHAEEALRRRPSPAVWSAKEYAGHVRDVLLVQRDRLIRALVEDNPSVARMHRDERIDLVDYATEDTAELAQGVLFGAALLTRVLDRVEAGQLDRPIEYNYPEPVPRDALWLGRHTLHEARHHLLDVRRTVGEA